MKIRVAINGFGRIGRILFRSLFQDPQMEVVAINNLSSLEGAAHLLKYDSSHGVSPWSISFSPFSSSSSLSQGGFLEVEGKKIPFFHFRSPKDIPWQKAAEASSSSGSSSSSSSVGPLLIFECTGVFKKREELLDHCHSSPSVKKILVSAPFSEADITVVYGVNHHTYKKDEHFILSNASCTTNCLAPLAKVLHENFGIEKGFMTTIHSYTSDQRLLDNAHKDLRRSRAASLSMIPTSTGAAKAVGLVLPELQGKIDGMAVRVPTPNVSLVDFVVQLQREAKTEDIKRAFLSVREHEGPLKSILKVEEKPLVSCDFNGNGASSIVDLPSCSSMGKLAKVLAWYDNEFGFCQRMVDVAKHVSSCGL